MTVILRYFSEIGSFRGALRTNSSATAERPRDARVTSIRKIAKWNFWATIFGDGGLRET